MTFKTLIFIVMTLHAVVTSLTADINRDSIASFPGHLIILPSGNFCSNINLNGRYCIKSLRIIED